MCIEQNEVDGKELPGAEQHGVGKRLAEAPPTLALLCRQTGLCPL